MIKGKIQDMIFWKVIDKGYAERKHAYAESTWLSAKTSNRVVRDDIWLNSEYYIQHENRYSLGVI
jgi:hypothetical protein